MDKYNKGLTFGKWRGGGHIRSFLRTLIKTFHFLQLFVKVIFEGEKKIMWRWGWETFGGKWEPWKY